jgi:hypothetical protein
LEKHGAMLHTQAGAEPAAKDFRIFMLLPRTNGRALPPRSFRRSLGGMR